MAYEKFIVCIIMVSYLTQEITFIHGRHLAPTITSQLQMHKVETQKSNALNKNLHEEHPKQGLFTSSLQSTSSNQAPDALYSPPPLDCLDEIKPTSPGRSPGVGH
ncbi:hypothetical protein Droror1_Dr00004680 [Drosera rotundifolia]